MPLFITQVWGGLGKEQFHQVQVSQLPSSGYGLANH